MADRLCFVPLLLTPTAPSPPCGPPPPQTVRQSQASPAPEVQAPPAVTLCMISHKVKLSAPHYTRHVPPDMRLNLLYAATSGQRYLATSKFRQGYSGKALLGLKVAHDHKPSMPGDLVVFKKLRTMSYADKCEMRREIAQIIESWGSDTSTSPVAPMADEVSQNASGQRRTCVTSEEAIMHEVRMQRAANSRARVHDVFDIEGDIYIALTAFDSSLFDVTRFLKPANAKSDSGVMRASLVLRFGIQLADELWRMHAAGIVHRDISASNVLIDVAKRCATFTDFGRASFVRNFAPNVERRSKDNTWGVRFVCNSAEVLVHNPKVFSLACGSLLAPECVASGNKPAPLAAAADLLCAVDVWALGATLIELLAADRDYRPLSAGVDVNNHVHVARTRRQHELFKRVWFEQSSLFAPQTPPYQPKNWRLVQYIDSMRKSHLQLARVLVEQVIVAPARDRLNALALRDTLIALEAENSLMLACVAQEGFRKLRGLELIKQPLVRGLFAVHDEMETREPMWLMPPLLVDPRVASFSHASAEGRDHPPGPSSMDAPGADVAMATGREAIDAPGGA